MSRVRLIIVCLLGVCLSFVAGYLGAYLQTSPVNPINVQQPVDVISIENTLFATISEQLKPSVVSIDIEAGTDTQATRLGSGTGFIITDDGYIITNQHVIEAYQNQSMTVGLGDKRLVVTLNDGTAYDDVRIIGSDSSLATDIAFLKIDTRHKFQPVKLGDSDTSRVGQRVLAIGNALGDFQSSVTTGIISGRGRPVSISNDTSGHIEQLTNLIQTDAAINPGNSGGPLVNVNAEVIGINTAKADDADNVGFAIPINDIKGVINSVTQDNGYKIAYLGVHYQLINKGYANSNNLAIDFGAHLVAHQQGGTVIQPDSPAAKAQLKADDIILAVNGLEINQYRGLKSLIGRHQVGDKVVLTVQRQGKKLEIEVVLAAAPSDVL